MINLTNESSRSDFIDDSYMQRCFVLAELGRYLSRPNPAVGCLIVKDGLVVAEGWTQQAGQAHAEVHALQRAGCKAADKGARLKNIHAPENSSDRVKGSTVYVSLEPCAHQGRTGPCTEALISAGVARVVYGMEDPNPLVAGKGLQRLRAAGIAVHGPVLQSQALAINPGFNKRMLTALPYVRCKLAMSLDGRTAMASGESKWITGPQARADVQLLRARSCAILTGSGTVLQDDPALTVRIPEYEGLQPMRVIVDSQGRVPANAKVLTETGVVVLARAEQFPGINGKVDLRKLLAWLASEHHCNEVLVEAGPGLSGAMLNAALVDELITYIAPGLLGDAARPLALLPGLEHLAQRLELRFADVAMLGKDCRIRSLPEPRDMSGSR